MTSLSSLDAENYFLLAFFSFLSLRFSFNVFVDTFLTLFWAFLPLAMSYSLFEFDIEKKLIVGLRINPL